MKKKSFLIAVLLSIVYCLLPTAYSFSQTPGEWTWMHGDNTSNSPGVFGTQGVPNPANKPPGLYEPCEWTDNNGNFWLFGGGKNGGLNLYAALWKYDPVTNQWIWMKGPSVINQPGVYGAQGVSSSANYPGSRAYGAVTWVDASGNLWLFGGYGYVVSGSGYLNDLWKYDILTNQWTWMKGTNTAFNAGSYGTQGVPNPSNLPPSRDETNCSWTDLAGNLWLYGSRGPGGGTLGDLWKYDISTNGWTWIHGANMFNPPSVYGTQGLAGPTNTPGGRMVYSSWADLAGNLWLFAGGYPFPPVAANNDLWKYDISTNQWTWMKGPSTTNDPGNYGVKCVSANNNVPPARVENRARVRDACGNFWNFGGEVNGGWLLNDLWHYNVSTNQWTWVSGDNISGGQLPVYGTQGVSDPANKPGAKKGSVAWLDNNGFIWIFGGIGGQGYCSDLFRYVPDTNCTPCTVRGLLSATVSSINVLCNGQCNGTATATPSNGISPYTYSWNTAPIQTTVNVTGLCAGTYTVTVIDVAGNTTTATVAITQPAVLMATATSTPAACGNNNGSVTVNAGGGTPGYSYSWSAAPAQTTQTITGLGAGNYTVIVTDANNCTQTQTVTVVSSSAITTSQSAGICSGSAYTLPGGTVVSIGGIYIDTLTAKNGCDSIITTNFTVNPNPMATVFSVPAMSGQVVTITQGQSVTLTATGGGTYSWSPATGLNCTTCATVTVIPTSSGQGGLMYCVTVTDTNNCTDSVCVTVIIEPDCSNAGELYLPNAFSPNDDGENDKLQIYYGNEECISVFKLVIYDRWGEKMFETTEPAKEWDGFYKGKLLNAAVFVYYMKADLLLGQEIIRKGNISLIR